LSKIQEWIDCDLGEPGEPHHQLVMDLEIPMTCCRMLISRMDAEISELYQQSTETLDTASKVKLIFEGKTMDELQKMIERQTDALTLLRSSLYI
jgi:guanine nucleotide-binding protein G(i) subunit alpha